MKHRQLAGPPCPKVPEHGPLLKLNVTGDRPYWCALP